MSAWQKVAMGDLIVIASDKVNASQIDIEKYVSTDNLMPNLGGIEIAKSLPNQEKYISFGIGDVLFSNIRTYFKKVWQARFNGGCSNDVLVFKTKDPNLLDQDFLYYVLSNQGFIDYTALTAKGTKMPRGDKEAIRNYFIDLPSLEDQKEIAKTLSNLDKKITLLRQQNKTLEELAQTLFKRRFVEDALDDWETIHLSDIIEIKGGYSYKGSEIGQGTSLLLGMGCVSNREWFLSKGARFYADDAPESYLVEPGNIVLATRQQSENLPILGYPAIIPPEYKDKKVIVGTNLYSIKNNSSIDNEILFLLLRSRLYREHIIHNSKGTTVKMITKDAVESFEFKMPPSEILDKLQNTVRPLINKLKGNQSEIQILIRFRDTLLPKLMSGELRVNA